MRINIQQSYQPHSEGIWAITNLANGEGLDDTRQSLMGRYPAAKEEIELWFAPLVKLEQAVAKQVDLEDGNIQFLCKILEETQKPLSEMMLIDPADGVIDSRIRMMAMYDYFEEGRLNAEGDAVVQNSGILFASDEQVHAYIQSLPYQYATKAALLYVYDNFADLHAYLKGISAKVQQVMEQFADVLAPYLDGVLEYIANSPLKEGNLTEFFAELDVPLTIDSEQLNLYPTVFHPNGLTMTQWGLEDPLDLHLGVLFLRILELSEQRQLSPEQLMDVMKALSDKTKFEIIQLVGRQPMYGGQLAEQLGLTAATISHHISQLTALRLIRIEKAGGRIYYEQDKQVLQEYLDALGAQLI
ncbi:ArsR family transcriptional regulator [Eubacteriales bacterium OttesenSCG-928-N14]|nr:ArsR family transcriptional regulator [Eubacteriales bacterium OttesenSCG-928-N14]